MRSPSSSLRLAALGGLALAAFAPSTARADLGSAPASTNATLTTTSGAPPPAAAAGPTGASGAATAAAAGSPTTPNAAAPGSAAAPTSPAAATGNVDLQSAAADFTAQARAVLAAVACDGSEPPARLPRAMVDAHCKVMNELTTGFRDGWVKKLAAFLADIRPAGLPEAVVYPFGGGDLVSALATFPEAKEVETLSVELAGDPRGIDTISEKGLAELYRVTEKNIALQFRVAHSRTDNLAHAEGGVVNGELVFSLVALVAMQQDLTGLRFFEIKDDGTLDYVSAVDVAAYDAAAPAARKPIFQHMEVAFTPKGGGATRVQRHFAVNLDNNHLNAEPGTIRFLESKGKVAAMTKAASYLIWGPRFAVIREYLLKNMVWMCSDSTGIAPSVASAAGFEQITYGTFQGPFLNNATKGPDLEMIEMWKNQPARNVPLPYGYPDNARHWHFMVTRPKTAEGGRSSR